MNKLMYVIFIIANITLFLNFYSGHEIFDI